MTDLTAPDGTLFEPHLNGLNHRKNSNGQLNLFELIQTTSAAATACGARGLSHSVAISHFLQVLQFFGQPQTICARYLYAIRTALAPVLLGFSFFLVSTFLFTISHWPLPLLQMQRLLSCPKR